MVCCKCNKTGKCKGCSCVKEGKHCINCLPGKMGVCANVVTSSTLTSTSASSLASNQSDSSQGQSPVATTTTATTTITTTTDSMTTSNIATNSTPLSPVPSIQTPEQQPLNFSWGVYSGKDIFDEINSAYEEIIHWIPNLFLVPFGSTGTSFVKEVARLFQAFADGSSLERISMKAITLVQILLLQKPGKRSKTKDHICHLKRRLDLWHNGDIRELLDEGRSIQARLISRKAKGKNDIDNHIFRSLMAQGKVKSALRYISSDSSGGVLGLNDIIPQTGEMTTRDVLKLKHPPGQPANTDSMLDDEPVPVNPIIYSDLDADCIRKAAMNTQGAAGLSGLDAYAWRRLCSSFKLASNDLCDALAAVGRRICSSDLHPDDLSAFVACRLIPLNKCPGVRPIGVGEVPRRIIAKAVLSLLRHDIQDAAGPLQVCAGQEGGCEAAVHAMRQFFDEDNVHGALLVDASNAFNTINRQAALHNIKIICPSLYRILLNTYRAPIRCIVCGDGEITSSEGTTQGDPLAMAMYALAVKPLIGELKQDAPSVKQVWYADDASGAGTCDELKIFWDSLKVHGSGYGRVPP